MKKKPQMWTVCADGKETINLGANTKMIVKWEVFTKEEQVVKPTIWNRIVSFVKRIKLKNPISVTPKEQEVVEVEEPKVIHDRYDVATDDATDIIISKQLESLSKIKDGPIKSVTEKPIRLDDIEPEVVLIEDDEQPIAPEQPVIKEIPTKEQKQDDKKEETVSIPETEKILNLSKPQVYVLVKDGKLKSRGRRPLRILKSSINEFLKVEEQRKNPQPPEGYMTIADAMKAMQKSYSTIYVLIKHGKLKSTGYRPQYVLISDVEDMIKQKQEEKEINEANKTNRCYICGDIRPGTRQRCEENPKLYCDSCYKRHINATSELQTYLDRLKEFPDATISCLDAAALLDLSISGIYTTAKRGITYRKGKDGNILLVDVINHRRKVIDQVNLTKEVLSSGIKVLTVSESTKQLKRSIASINKYIRDGKLKAYDTKPIYIAQSEIDRFLKENK